MARNKLIFDILKGKNTLRPELKNSEEQASRLSKTIGGIGSGFSALAPVFAGIFAAVGFKKAIDASVELKNSLIGLRSVAGNMGADVDAVTDAAKELAKDGLVPLTDVSNSLKSLMASGFSGEEAVKVFKSLREAAAFNRQGQLSLGEALRGAADGIKNQNSIMVDNAGITKNLSVIYKEYAASIGTTVGKLSEVEKRQALIIGLGKEASAFQGDYNKLLDTFSGNMTRVTTNFNFFLAALGNFVTDSPKAFSLLSQLGDGIETVTKFLERANTQSLGEINSEIATLEKRLVDTRVSLSAFLKSGKTGIFGTDFFSPVKAGREEVQELSSELAILKSKRDALLNGKEKSGGGSPDEPKEPPAVDQKAIDAARKTAEQIAAIKEEFALLEEEKRLEKGAFLSTAEEERFVALEERLGRELAVKLQATENLADSEIEVLKSKLKKEQELEKQRLKDKKENTKTEASMLDGLFKFEKSVGAQRVANQRGTLDAIATLSSSSNKTLFAIGKAAAIATATIDGIKGVQKTIGAYVYPANIALGALVAAASAANIAKIASTKAPGRQNGGFLDAPFSTGDQQVFSGNRDEVVLNKAQQSELFNIANGRTAPNKDSEGGNVIDITVELDGIAVGRALRNMQNDGIRIA